MQAAILMYLQLFLPLLKVLAWIDYFLIEFLLALGDFLDLYLKRLYEVLQLQFMIVITYPLGV